MVMVTSHIVSSTNSGCSDVPVGLVASTLKNFVHEKNLLATHPRPTGPGMRTEVQQRRWFRILSW